MINLEHVSFGYIKQPMLFLDVSLKIDNGNVFVFGQEGSGKTSLLELLCGMQTLYVGKIQVFKKLPQDSTLNITYLPVDVVALKSKTVLQNLQYACDAINKDYSIIDLEDDFIKQFGNIKLKKLSNFNKAIFALKRAKIKDAKVLLIDINLTGFSDQEITQYSQMLNELLKDNNKVVIVAVCAEDYKKLELDMNNSQIAYLFATKMYQFKNLSDFKNSLNFMGMADYLPFNKYDATVNVSQSGNYLKVLDKTIKLEDKYIQNIAEYFDDTTTSTKVKIYTNLSLDSLSDKDFNNCLNEQSVLIYDSLTTQKLN